MHEQYMRRALALARLACGCTSPNPMVGAVIVKNGQVVGEGFHAKAGTPHAEIHALKQAGELARGATLYVTLEPCSHYGRTGPCVQSIIQAGIAQVVVAMTDPNPLVAGRGLQQLRQAGIEVIEGVLAKEAARLNEVFIKWITTKMPFVVLKTAMSLDGKIATSTGDAKWITGPAARRRVHLYRQCYDAILVGIGTVLADDPALTVRLPGATKNPLRVIVDSQARTPLTAQVVTDGKAPTIIAVAPDAPPERVAALRATGAEIMVVPRGYGGIDLRQLLAELGRRQITSVLVEGGSRINGTFFAENLVDKVYWFVAPKFIGGEAAPGPIGGQGATSMREAVLLEDLSFEQIEEDFLISGYIVSREGRDVYRHCGRIGHGSGCAAGKQIN
mgnify:CR=1 FL=1